MTVEIERRGEITIFRVAGELTGGDRELSHLVFDTISGHGARAVIDLGQVSFVSSRGIGELVNIVGQGNVQEQRIVLANPAPMVAGVFETTRLNKFFEIYSSTEDALADLQP